MSVVDEIEFERLQPICFCCGALLTFDEWELNSDICNLCYEAAEYEDLLYNN